jgi:hypothetical protein
MATCSLARGVLEIEEATLVEWRHSRRAIRFHAILRKETGTCKRKR